MSFKTDIFSYLYREVIDSGEDYHGSKMLSSSDPGCMISTWLLPGDIIFDHLVKMVSAWVLYYKDTIFPLSTLYSLEVSH